MNIDERLEALTQSVELMRIEQEDFDRKTRQAIQVLLDLGTQTDRRLDRVSEHVDRVSENVDRLSKRVDHFIERTDRIIEIHERRMTDLEH